MNVAYKAALEAIRNNELSDDELRVLADWASKKRKMNQTRGLRAGVVGDFYHDGELYRGRIKSINDKTATMVDVVKVTAKGTERAFPGGVRVPFQILAPTAKAELNLAG